MINVYDFEVFKKDWLVVIVNPVENTEVVIVNNKSSLEEYYNKHKSEIWVGYNSRGYDQYILKGIMSGLVPTEVKQVNDYI